MAIRVYLVPVVGSGTPIDPRRAKYVAGVIAGRAIAMDYGLEPVMLVAADVTPAEHTTIAANADVVAVPANLDATVGAALGTVQAALESVNVPGDWVTAGMTYRTVLVWTARLFLIAQRLHGQANVALFQLSQTLDTLVSAVPAAQRQQLATAAVSLGLDPSGITGAMTLRQALVLLGNQMTLPIGVLAS